MSSKLLLEQK